MNTTATKVEIESITVKRIFDDMPDTSTLGEYTSNCEPGVIVRHYGEFYEKIKTGMERDYDGRFIGKAAPEIPALHTEHTCFRPYAGGEKPGTKNYYEYGMQDYKRMEGLNNGDWCYIGIMAEAVVKYPDSTDCGSYRLETLTSGGLWGIESDSEESYLESIEQEELADLKNHLATFGIEWNDEIEIEHKDF